MRPRKIEAESVRPRQGRTALITPRRAAGQRKFEIEARTRTEEVEEVKYSMSCLLSIVFVHIVCIFGSEKQVRMNCFEKQTIQPLCVFVVL